MRELGMLFLKKTLEFINSKKAKVIIAGIISNLYIGTNPDIPPETIQWVIGSITSLVLAYIGGQSYIDRDKEKNGNGA